MILSLRKTLPESDLRLAETANKYQNVIFAGKVLTSQRPENPVRLFLPFSPITEYNLPWGIVNMEANPDGFIRKYTLFENLIKPNSIV